MLTASSTDAMLHLNTVGAARLNGVTQSGTTRFARVAFVAEWKPEGASDPVLTVAFADLEQLGRLIAALQQARDTVAAEQGAGQALIHA